MKNQAIIFLLFFVFVLPICVSAQLSDSAIDELTTSHVDKWSQYLNLSKYRKDKLKNIWSNHERNKSEILRFSNDIKDQLEEENLSFLSSLSNIFTPKELEFYKMTERLRMEDDREYLASLVDAISTDSLFIEAYTNLQYNKIFPFKMSLRMELEEAISISDKVILESIRADIFEHYDKCLLTCLVDGHSKSELFQSFNELIVVALNEDLKDSKSGLSQLIKLTHKYEEDIHNIYFKYKEKFSALDLRNKELKKQYILDGYNESLLDLRKRNGLNTINHLESEATFLLLDPYDHNVSRKLFNLDLYNRL